MFEVSGLASSRVPMLIFRHSGDFSRGGLSQNQLAGVEAARVRRKQNFPVILLFQSVLLPQGQDEKGEALCPASISPG